MASHYSLLCNSLVNVNAGFLNEIQGETEEIELVKGADICVTTDPRFEKRCSTKCIYVDYKNITNCVKVGSRIYIDDGFLSLIIEKIGRINSVII